MDILQFIILALIQGITEFLPVSSSAHLILLPLLTDWQDQGLTIDIAAHVGSLLAVIVYFRGELSRMLRFSVTSANHPDARLCYYLILASMPVLFIGFLSRDVVALYLREPVIIAATSIGFGLLLWLADIKGQRHRQLTSINMLDVVIIGFAQSLALIPGTSRSGITMTACLLIGLDRKNAAYFSFLMSIPVILAAGGHALFQLTQSNAPLYLTPFLIVMLLSATSAFITIHYFLKLINAIGLLPFVLYRVVLGIMLLFLFV